MSFHIAFVSIVTVLVFNLNCPVVCHDRDKQHNRTTIFTFQDVKYCAKNEFYDLNYFRCIPCKMLGENLQPSVDSKYCCVSVIFLWLEANVAVLLGDGCGLEIIFKCNVVI